jgi:hypothetical protein
MWIKTLTLQMLTFITQYDFLSYFPSDFSFGKKSYIMWTQQLNVESWIQMLFQNRSASYFHRKFWWESYCYNGKRDYKYYHNWTHHNIAEILLKLALCTNQSINKSKFHRKSSSMNTWLLDLPVPHVQNRLKIGWNIVSCDCTFIENSH